MHSPASATQPLPVPPRPRATNCSTAVQNGPCEGRIDILSCSLVANLRVVASAQYIVQERHLFFRDSSMVVMTMMILILESVPGTFACADSMETLLSLCPSDLLSTPLLLISHRCVFISPAISSLFDPSTLNLVQQTDLAS